MDSSYKPIAEIVAEKYIERFGRIYSSLEEETEIRLRWNIDHWKSKPLLERAVVKMFQGVFVPYNEDEMRYEASRSILSRRESK